MLHWTLLGEIYSFFVLMILFLRYYLYERDSALKKRRMFVRCLTLSMAFIVLNVVCVYALERPGLLPRWVNTLLNVVYFQGGIMLCSLYGYLLFQAMLEHVYDKHCLLRAVIMLCIVCGISAVLLVVNGFTGIIFSIDEAGLYHRGPLNRIYYGLLVTELIFLVVCYFRNRASVNDKMLYVLRCIFPVVLLLCILQVTFPDVLLNGTICALVSLVIFIAFRSHTEERDSLTSAGSRTAFIDELALRSGSSQSVHILQIALLNISDVNLRYSHAVGDALIYEVSHYLRHTYHNAQVYRSSSTTFTLILPLVSDAEANAILLSIQDRLGKAWVLGETECHLVTAIAEMRRSNLTGNPSEIVEQLEYTMSLAKESPPLARFDEETQARFDRRTHLVELMRRSIEQKRFRVFYQPIYCCHRDLFCSAEALLRLSDDNGDPIRPDVFIPLAEENGMIEDLTWIVLEDCCRLLSSGALPKLESISLNLSMKQFLNPELPHEIDRYLRSYHVDPSRIKVEITERFILHDAQYAKSQMQALEELGINIYMDDFGTGYSNLSSVLHYPFSFIKLDRSLIAPAVESRQSAIMISALMKLFHELGKRVIVEGVEEQAQVDFLRSIGSDMIQGYFYAKPVPAQSLTPYFREED